MYKYNWYIWCQEIKKTIWQAAKRAVPKRVQWDLIGFKIYCNKIKQTMSTNHWLGKRLFSKKSFSKKNQDIRFVTYCLKMEKWKRFVVSKIQNLSFLSQYLSECSAKY